MNVRQERFAQLLHKGTPLLDAYEGAGYPRDPGNAARAHKLVRPRLRELAGLPPADDDMLDTATRPVHWRKGAARLDIEAAEAVGKKGVSMEALIGFQLQILELAVKAGSTAAATVAVKQLAQLQGLWIERSEAKQIVEKAEHDPKRIARALLDVLDRQMVDVTPGEDGACSR